MLFPTPGAKRIPAFSPVQTLHLSSAYINGTFTREHQNAFSENLTPFQMK